MSVKRYLEKYVDELIDGIVQRIKFYSYLPNDSEGKVFHQGCDDIENYLSIGVTHVQCKQSAEMDVTISNLGPIESSELSTPLTTEEDVTNPSSLVHRAENEWFVFEETISKEEIEDGLIERKLHSIIPKIIRLHVHGNYNLALHSLWSALRQRLDDPVITTKNDIVVDACSVSGKARIRFRETNESPMDWLTPVIVLATNPELYSDERYSIKELQESLLGIEVLPTLSVNNDYKVIVVTKECELTKYHRTPFKIESRYNRKDGRLSIIGTERCAFVVRNPEYLVAYR